MSDEVCINCDAAMWKCAEDCPWHPSCLVLTDCPHRTLVMIPNGHGDAVWVCAKCDAAFTDAHRTPLEVPVGMQLPRPYYFQGPVERAVGDAWNDFTAPDYPIPVSPGIDFDAIPVSAFAGTGPKLPPLGRR
jgi:hypothetical protein